MPPITDAALPTVESPDQVRAREQAIADFQRQNETGILDSIAAGKNLWVDMSLVRMVEQSGFDEDPNFILDEKKLNELSQGVDDRFRVMFSGAKSDAHAQVLRAHALELTGAYRDLGNAGFVGKTAGTLAQIASPITLSAGLLTGGLGTGAIAGGSAARLAAAARAGLITGATFGGLEAFKATQDPTITGGDVATAALGGALFGAANPFTAQSGRLVRAAVGGATQAAPGMIAEFPSLARGERPTTEYLLSAASNFALGGAFAAIHKGQEPDIQAANVNGTKATLRMAKDAQFAEIKQAAQDAGVTVESVMTDQGKAHFAEQMADQTPRTVKNAEPIIAEADAANLELERLANEQSAEMPVNSEPGPQPDAGATAAVDSTASLPVDAVSQSMVPVEPNAMPSSGDVADGYDMRNFRARDDTQAYQEALAMTPDELLAKAEVVRSESNGQDERILGDNFEAWNKAQRTLERSSDDAKIAKAQAIVDQIEAPLSKADQNALYGIGAEGLSPSDYIELARDYQNMQSLTIEETTSDLASLMPYLPKSDVPDFAPTSRDFKSLNKLRAIEDNIRANGWDMASIAKNALQMAANSFSDPEDAAFVLRNLLRKRGESPASSEQAPPALALPAPGPRELPAPKSAPRTGPRPFTKADLERRIQEVYQGSPVYDTAEATILAREAGLGDNTNGTFDQGGVLTFTGNDFPGEIKSMLESPDGKKYRRFLTLQKPVLNPDGTPSGMVRVGKKIVPKRESTGADFFAQHPDQFLAYLDELAGGGRVATAVQKLRAVADNDPQTKLLLHLYDNLPEGRTPAKQTVDAQELPTGATFTINDERFHVEETPEGYRVLRDGQEFPIDGLSEIPIDKGTLRLATPEETATRQADAANDAPLTPEENTAFMKAFSASNLSEMDLLDMSNAEMRAMIRTQDMPTPPPDVLGLGSASPATISKKAANAEVVHPVLPGDFNPTGSTAEWDTTLLGVRARWDMGAYLGTSKSSMARMLANAVANDQLPKKGGRASEISADVVADRQKTIASQKIHTEMDGLYSDFVTNAKNNGLKMLTRDQFEAEVSKTVRRPDGSYTSDPVVNRAAKFVRDVIEEHRAYAERHNVPGFDKFGPSETYLTRIGDRTKLDEMITARGLDTVEGVVSKAIQVGTPAEMLTKIGEVLAKSKIPLAAGAAEDAVVLASRALAKMWVRNIGRRGVSHELLMQKFFEPGHRVEMANSLRAAFGRSISKEQIKEIIDIISPERDDLQNISIARRRIQMDETYSEIMPDGTSLSIEDMLVNNASDIAERYAHGAIHASMFAKIRELMTPNGPGAKKPTTVAGVLKVLKQDMVGSGVPLSRMKADLYRAEILLKQTAGIPVIDSAATRAAISTIKNTHFGRLMSSVYSGINNFAEVSDVVSTNGAKAFLQVVPAWGDILKTVATGKANGDLVGTLQRFGQGAERASRRIHSAIGDNEEVPKTLAQMQRFSAKYARIAGDVSLQSFGTDTMTLLASAISTQRMFSIAGSGRPLGSRWAARFASIGWTEAKWNRIAAELRNAPYDRGILGKRMKQLDLDSWQDREAAAWFVDGLTKNTRQLVLKDSPAERAAWMTSPMGQLLVQLRTYSYGAWTKKFLYGVKVDGAYTAVKWGVASMFAALAYMGRTQLAAALLPSDQREKYLADRMSTESIVKAGFSRASWSSLIPMGVDTGLSLAGRDPAFSFARTSGLVGGKGPWGALIGNPTFDAMDKFARGVTGVVAPITIPGRDFTQDDARAIRDALWVPNVIGAKEVFEQLISGLPRKPKN